MKGTPWLILSLALGSCTEVAVAPTIQPAETDYSPGHHEYGIEGSITQQQYQELQTLAWPQAYEDIKGAYGFPTHRTETADYYQLEDSSQWVVIEYAGRQATGYRIEN